MFYLDKVSTQGDGSFVVISEAAESYSNRTMFSRWDYFYGGAFYNPYMFYYWNRPFGFYPWARFGWGNPFMFNRWMNPYASFGYPSVTYNANNIALLSFDIKGNLQWVKTIDKKQTDQNVDQFIGYGTLENDKGMSFVYHQKQKGIHQLIVNTLTKDGQLTKSNSIILNEKNKNGIIEKETELSNFNSRTLKQDEYKKFIVNKNKINKQVSKFYNNILFRKLGFRRYVRTKQSEINLLNEIENKYLTKDEQKQGKKLLIAHGDYSRTSQMKGCVPCPNIGIKKLLASRFEIIDVNEYNTSKLYNKTFTELENVSIRRNKHKKHLHEILTLKGNPENRIFVNRDVNACKNILYLVKYYLQYQGRPKEFKPEEKGKNTKKNKKGIVV